MYPLQDQMGNDGLPLRQQANRMATGTSPAPSMPKPPGGFGGYQPTGKGPGGLFGSGFQQPAPLFPGGQGEAGTFGPGEFQGMPRPTGGPGSGRGPGMGGSFLDQDTPTGPFNPMPRYAWPKDRSGWPMPADQPGGGNPMPIPTGGPNWRHGPLGSSGLPLPGGGGNQPGGGLVDTGYQGAMPPDEWGGPNRAMPIGPVDWRRGNGWGAEAGTFGPGEFQGMPRPFDWRRRLGTSPLFRPQVEQQPMGEQTNARMLRYLV